jgi:hypothetical protein
MPKVQVTVSHGIPNQKQDAMSVWIESVTTNQFEVCLQESRTFDGPHNNLVVVCKGKSTDFIIDFFSVGPFHYFISNSKNG